MWEQPRFQLTVHKTRGVTAKGKHGYNDMYAVVVFGREKHKTAVEERCIDGHWQENCYLSINLTGNDSGKLFVKVCHRNFRLSSDEVIGQVEVLLKHFTSYESPKTSWFTLKNKTSSMTEGEIKLTLTYHAVIPTNLDNPSMTTSVKGFAKILNIGKSIARQRRREESLSELTKKDCEIDKELSALEIMPGDLKCLYWDAGQEGEEKDNEEDVTIRTNTNKQSNMVNLANTRRHSFAFNKINLDHSHPNKDSQNRLRQSDTTHTIDSLSNKKTSQDQNDMSCLRVKPITYSNSQKSLISPNEFGENNLSIDQPSSNQSNDTSTKTTIAYPDADSSANETKTKSQDSTDKFPENNENKNNNNNNKNNINNNNYTNQDDENNLEKECSQDGSVKNSLKDEHLGFIKEMGERVKSVQQINSRNLLENHFNQFSKQELIQLILDQREWIKARELYILEIEAYQKTLLLKVLDQSSRNSPMKRSVRNSFIEEINLGVNHVLQKKRLNNEKNIREIKAEGKSFAKKWFGALFKAK